MKLQLAVFFGGRSVEHDVSIVTGIQAAQNVDPAKYEIIPVYIARDGKWYTGRGLLDIGCYANFRPDGKKVKPAYLSPVPGEGLLVGSAKRFGKPERIVLDAALLCMHGLHGEDGSLQGLLELCDVPYTSPSVVGSAAGMDKAVMKRIFLGCGFPTVPFVDYTRDVWAAKQETCISEIESELGYPVYVKPANLGSSIGISRATDQKELLNAIQLAFAYDRKIVVERGVADPTEINCSVLGLDGDVQASPCEKPLGWKDFLTFDDKYMRGGKGTKGKTREIPAPIGEEMTTRIQTLACDIFRAMDCKGVVRIDFLIDNASGALYVNEINTIPGSLSFYLWEPAGLSYPKLIDRLVSIAQKAMKEKKANQFAYDSNLIQKVKNGFAPAKAGK